MIAAWSDTMKMRVIRFLRKLHSDTSGAMSVEKIFILGLIALPILIIIIAFKDKLLGWFSGQADQLKAP